MEMVSGSSTSRQGRRAAIAACLLGALAASAAAAPSARLVLRSPAVEDGGQLPEEYAGDGGGLTLPLEWSGAPRGTKCFALIMHHTAPDMIKWYWILYDIPAGVKRLPKNAKGIGKLGNNSVNGRTEYAPPHSKGPGRKTYIYTLYALSARPKLAVRPAEVDRAVLLAAMKGLVLGKAELSVDYERFPGQEGGRGDDPPPPPRREEPGRE